MAGHSRALLPVLALVVGTFVGMRRPSARPALESTTDAASAKREARAGVSSVPPVEGEPPPVDAGAIADPAKMWPSLNPSESMERAWLVTEGPAHAPEDGRRLVTFTFDDGPFPETTPTVLRILARHGIRATFFFIGEYLEGESHRAVETRQWARRIAEAGHCIGNHTRDHRLLTALSHTAALDEIDRAGSAIEAATGQRPWLFRPPYGALDPWLEGALRDRGLELLLWSVDVQDIKDDDADEIVRRVQEQLEYKQGGVVLLHDVHPASVQAFGKLVGWLEANRWDPAHPERHGWKIVDLGEYMRATAAAPQPYPSRDDLERARRAASEAERTRSAPRPS
jgi:peptidoglycan/xylan/chitin deacetylase (PgdA/CDA1 family)